jgi:hypothetical protein
MEISFIYAYEDSIMKLTKHFLKKRRGGAGEMET